MERHGDHQKCKIELCDSLIGTKVLYGLETISMLPREERRLDVAQIRIYRTALGLAPPYIATQKGLEYMKNDDVLLMPPRGAVRWSERVRAARARLLKDCKNAAPEEPIRIAIYQIG